MKRLLILALICMSGAASIGQTHRLKGNGQIFWEEHFNWENPNDVKGWTAPAGWKIEDLSGDGPRTACRGQKLAGMEDIF
jgi:hypothetical protein